MSPTKREQEAKNAAEHLTRAAAALSEWWMGDNLAFALLETGKGLLVIRELDTKRKAYKRVMADLEAAS